MTISKGSSAVAHVVALVGPTLLRALAVRYVSDTHIGQERLAGKVLVMLTFQNIVKRAY
jgi:hypothetical protein